MTDYKLVPVEPTEEMFFDPDEACTNFQESPWDAFCRIYTTMLAAYQEQKNKDP